MVHHQLGSSLTLYLLVLICLAMGVAGGDSPAKKERDPLIPGVSNTFAGSDQANNVGEAEEQERLIPVIAVVNTAGPDQEALNEAWESFRENWPERKFCVLRVLGAENLLIPLAMSMDANVMISNVYRDYGEEFKQADWFDVCNIQANSVPNVALLISVANIHDDTEEDFEKIVSASTAYFGTRLGEVEQEAILVSPRRDGNWIEPLDRAFFNPTNPPTRPPTRRPTGRPTRRPTGRPTRTPTRRPTGRPTRRPTGRPTRTPTRRPTRSPTRRPTPAPTRLPTPFPTPFGPSVPGTIITSVEMAYSVPDGAVITEPSDEELQNLETATFAFFESTMADAFGTTAFLGQVPVGFDSFGEPFGWTAFYLAEQIFSDVPSEDAVVSAIDTALFTFEYFEILDEVGPYFAQVGGYGWSTFAILATSSPTFFPTQNPTQTPTENPTDPPIPGGGVPTPFVTPTFSRFRRLDQYGNEIPFDDDTFVVEVATKEGEGEGEGEE